MAAATRAAAALPATSGGSRGVSDTSAGAEASEETISASLAAEVSPATAGGVPGSARAAAAAEASLSGFAGLQQSSGFLQECQGRQAFGGWAPQRAPWLQGQQPCMPAPGGVCCVAPWANDVARTAAPFLSSRGGPSDRVEDSAAAASATAAAAAALYPDEAPLLCCEKKIRTVRDLGFWMSSSSYSHYVGFLRRLSLAVIDKKAWRCVPESLVRRLAAATPTTAAETTSPAPAGASSAVASSDTSCFQDTPSSSSSNTSSNSPNAAPSSSAGPTNASSSSSGDSSSSTVRQSHDPLRLLEEFSESKKHTDSGSQSSSRTTDTSCNTLSAEPDTRQRRSSTEGLSTSTAGTAATEAMIEAALLTGHAEAKHRAAALAAAAQDEGLHVSEAVVQLVELLQQLLVWVDDIKPVEQPMRFGNKAFRTWLQRLENCCQRLLTPLIPALPRPPPAALLCETIEEDPEQEAAEAATTSPPPGMAASSTSSLNMSFTSAPSASAFADSAAAVQQRAKAAADQDVSAEVTSGSSSNSSSVRASTGGDCISSSSSSGEAGAAETSSGSAAALAAVERERDDDQASSGARSAGSSSSTSRRSEDSDAAADRRTVAERAHDKKKAEDGEESKKGSSFAEDEEEDVGGSFVRKELLKELIDYLCHSFGDARRLDYGTGHEASFALFLLVLFEAHVLREGVDDAATVLLVFTQYVEVCHALQRRYSLEPAGSRGAWGLDDFHFLPFLFGSAQLQEQLFISPAQLRRNWESSGRISIFRLKADLSVPWQKKAATTGVRMYGRVQVMEPAVVHEMAVHNLYFSSIEYIMQTKRGAPFSECAPMLYDISGISSWKKIHAGLLRMYEGEVLNKFPIAQHFLFGRYFPLNLLDASGSSP